MTSLNLIAPSEASMYRTQEYIYVDAILHRDHLYRSKDQYKQGCPDGSVSRKHVPQEFLKPLLQFSATLE